MNLERGARDAGPGSKIGLVASVAFAVGAMVGAGVFVLSGLAVKRAGPAALACFGLAGFLVLLSALSFAVVASLAPPGRSGYAYVGTGTWAATGASSRRGRSIWAG